jgi:hypothetical protein
LTATKLRPDAQSNVTEVTARMAREAASPEANPSRAMPRIYEWIDLPPEKAGEGAKVLVWTNFPQTWGERLDQATDDGERMKLLHMFIRDHDLYDFDGFKLPDAATDAFIKSVPVTLWPIMFQEAANNLVALPKGMPPQ